MAKKSNLFGRADASLVNAAFREGMTRGPGNLSGPLKEQLNTNSMMWEMIGKEFNKAFGDTIARNEEFKEATDKVMGEFQSGTAYDESMMQMYDTEIKGIRNRIRGAKKGSLEERKLYAELERLKNSSENYTQTMLNIGTFVKNDQHNPIATGENLSLYNAIANNTVVRKIENGKLLVSETGEEGTFKDFNDLKKSMILKDHQNHNDLLKYAETRQKEAKNNPKMIFDSQEGINYIETNNFKTREAFADIITTRVGNMKYSFLEAAYGKDRKVIDQIDGALAGVNTQNLVNKGLDKSNDGKISSADFTTKENKEAIIKAITDINDENFDFQVAKRVAAEFYNDGLVQPYYLRGVRNRSTGSGSGSGSDSSSDNFKDVPSSLIKSFPVGTNYGSANLPGGGSISITGDTFINLWRMFNSGVLKTTDNQFNLQKEGYWEDKDGKRYGGTEMLQMFQPPKGPSLLNSTSFNKFKGDLTEQMMFVNTPFDYR